ncbi:MAG: hypothetical protein CL949_22650 [Erythrobacter sp.]|nr:hypothetical protein [Erythrobacter sp.]
MFIPSLRRAFVQFLADESGASTTEYALLIALIGAGLAFLAAPIGGELSQEYGAIGSEIANSAKSGGAGTGDGPDTPIGNPDSAAPDGSGNGAQSGNGTSSPTGTGQGYPSGQSGDNTADGEGGRLILEDTP